MQINPALFIDHSDNRIGVTFSEPHQVLSWAIVGGGRRLADSVAWYFVTRSELPRSVDPIQLLEKRMADSPYAHGVGLLTSRHLYALEDVERSEGDLSVRCLATIGLSNALRVGDPVQTAYLPGTINMLCRVSCPLTEEGLLEALAIAAEAKTTAVLEAGLQSPISGETATGTGTDCIVIAAPATGSPLPYAGKHTLLGHLLGAAARQAVEQGVRAWIEERKRGDHE